MRMVSKGQCRLWHAGSRLLVFGLTSRHVVAMRSPTECPRTRSAIGVVSEVAAKDKTSLEVIRAELGVLGRYVGGGQLLDLGCRLNNEASFNLLIH